MGSVEPDVIAIKGGVARGCQVALPCIQAGAHLRLMLSAKTFGSAPFGKGELVWYRDRYGVQCPGKVRWLSNSPAATPLPGALCRSSCQPRACAVKLSDALR